LGEAARRFSLFVRAHDLALARRLCDRHAERLSVVVKGGDVLAREPREPRFQLSLSLRQLTELGVLAPLAKRLVRVAAAAAHGNGVVPSTCGDGRQHAARHVRVRVPRPLHPLHHGGRRL